MVNDDKIIHEISFSKFACPPRHNLVCIGVDHWPSSGAQVMIDVNLGCQVSERDQGYRGISYLNASWQLKAGSTRGRLSVPSMQSLQRFWKRIPLCRVPTTSIPGIPQGYIAVWVTVTFLSDRHFRRVGYHLEKLQVWPPDWLPIFKPGGPQKLLRGWDMSQQCSFRDFLGQNSANETCRKQPPNRKWLIKGEKSRWHWFNVHT